VLLLIFLRSSMSLVEEQTACSSVLCFQCRQLVLAKGKPTLFYGACVGSVENADCSFSNSLFHVKIVSI